MVNRPKQRKECWSLLISLMSPPGMHRDRWGGWGQSVQPVPDSSSAWLEWTRPGSAQATVGRLRSPTWQRNGRACEVSSGRGRNRQPAGFGKNRFGGSTSYQPIFERDTKPAAATKNLQPSKQDQALRLSLVVVVMTQGSAQPWRGEAGGKHASAASHPAASGMCFDFKRFHQQPFVRHASWTSTRRSTEEPSQMCII